MLLWLLYSDVLNYNSENKKCVNFAFDLFISILFIHIKDHELKKTHRSMPLTDRNTAPDPDIKELAPATCTDIATA